jgi:phosphopantetheinyl transferase
VEKIKKQRDLKTEIKKMSEEVKAISPKGAFLKVYEITESVDKMLEQLQLSEYELLRFKNIVSEKRKFEFLGIRIAFKEMFGKELEIRYDVDGKPYLMDNAYNISISHSKKWIAIMAHPTRPVGIDIECRNDKIQKIHKRFLSETEQKELSNGENTSQLELAWSAKEALFKIIGNQAVDFSKQLRIFPFDVKNQGEIFAENIPTNKKYELSYIQTAAYSLVYCLA